MNGEPQWREATSADVEAVVALVQRAYRGTGGWTSEVGLIDGARIDAPTLERAVRSSRTVVMVVPGGRGLGACCEVAAGEGGIAHFGLFAVDPEQQGGGIGRRLLDAARALAAERFGAHTLEIHVVSGQRALSDWYARLGFLETGETIPFPDDPHDRALVAGLHFIVMHAPTRRSPYALSWSGGKDSALALHALTAGGGPAPVALLTTVTDEYERISMHGVRCELLRRQARAAGVALVEVRIPAGASNAAYEQAMGSALARPPLDAVPEFAFGDLFLADIRDYRIERCAAAGRRASFPLWGRDTAALAARFIELGFRARIVCLDPRVMPPALAGREYDERLLAELPAGVDPCGENGEFHTFVYDGPVFSTPVGCVAGEVVSRDGFVFADLLAT